MTLLTVNNVSKSFGGVKALINVSFKVEKGELIGLVGPNGAGKTTLFNIISGVYKPDRGSVYFENDDITGKKPHIIRKKGISRTFQVVRLFDNMSVIENVAMPLLYVNRNISLHKIKNVARKWLEFVGLEKKEKWSINSLTFQEKRKVELARALVTNPKLLLIDEVAAGLTPSELNEIEHMIKQLNEEYNFTIIWVEHYFKSVARVCKRIIFLDRGRILADDKPDKVATASEVLRIYVGEEL